MILKMILSLIRSQCSSCKQLRRSMVLFYSAANEFGCPVLDSLQPLNVRCITTQKEPTSIVNARQYQTSNNKVACVNIQEASNARYIAKLII